MRGTTTSMGSSMSGTSAENKYLSPSDLEPLVNPELEWKMCINDIKSDNWSRQFEACNSLRKMCKFHIKELVYGGKTNQPIAKPTMEAFHEINIQVVKLVDSLRSTVSKQALITLFEMFETLPKQLLE